MGKSSLALCLGEMCFCILCTGEAPVLGITSPMVLALLLPIIFWLAFHILVKTEQLGFSPTDEITRRAGRLNGERTTLDAPRPSYKCILRRFPYWPLAESFPVPKCANASFSSMLCTFGGL